MKILQNKRPAQKSRLFVLWSKWRYPTRTQLKRRHKALCQKEFWSFFRGGIFEKNVKSHTKTTSKISLFEIWELIKQTISLSKFVLEVNKDYIYFLTSMIKSVFYLQNASLRSYLKIQFNHFLKNEQIKLDKQWNW